ncbi:membrane integrity-associated transporter subunit PqiC [Conchiformibius steedae]|uniref:PqiC family protein n=1 Tax=Conchiformibius steedae TaxID=153493 RepID=UPI0026F11977|nr:ABC-type transport auxiliary lipoprotein family protein [Conchiformibius steedae]
MRRFAFTLAAAAALLSACAAAPQTEYYQLPDSAFHAPRQTLTVLNVVLAEPLNSSGLLYQTDPHRVNIAQKNLWAEPLQQALSSALANKLNRLGGAFQPQHLAAGKTATLTVYLDRFQGTFHGHTEISGYAQRSNGSIQSFQVQTPQQGDGYGAMLDSLNQGLDEVARQIAP